MYAIRSYYEDGHPLIELESTAPGSWYVNAVATKADYRGQGIAKQLMAEAESKARQQGATTMSLIVASENTAAKALYRQLGYQLEAARPVVAYPGALHGGDWELLIKQL